MFGLADTVCCGLALELISDTFSTDTSNQGLDSGEAESVSKIGLRPYLGLTYFASNLL